MKKIILLITTFFLSSFLNTYAESFDMDLNLSWWKLQWTSDYIYYKHEIMNLNWENIWFFIPWWDKKVNESISENEVKIEVFDHNEKKIFEKNIIEEKNKDTKEEIEKPEKVIEKTTKIKNDDNWNNIIEKEKWNMSILNFILAWWIIIIIIWVFLFRQRKED